MATYYFDGTDEILDSRAILERINELELEYGPEDGDSIDTIHTEKMDDDELKEYEALNSLREEFDEVDFGDGITLIHEAYFEDYARELAYDIGAVDPDATWPVNRIDWDAAASDLKQDYTYVSLMGNTYYMHN